MSILVNPGTKILVQGVTGAFGARHTQLSLAYGTPVVAGVTPGKGGQTFENKVPIFDTVKQPQAKKYFEICNLRAIVAASAKAAFLDRFRGRVL